MKKRTLCIILGALAAFALFLAVLRLAGIADVRLLLKGWWALFLVIPGVMALLDRVGTLVPALMIEAGTLLFLAANGWIPYAAAFGLFLPVAAATVGIFLYWRGRHPKSDEYVPPHTDRERRLAKRRELPEVASSFGSRTYVPADEVFAGANLTVCFGTLTLDLREKQLKQGAQLHVFAAFGKLKILLPGHVDVVKRVTPVFSLVKDAREEGGVPLSGMQLHGLSLFSEVSL